MERFTLAKGERLCGRQLMDRLFKEGKSVTCFPLKVLLLSTDTHEGLLVMFSVPKKKLRHAVDRNRVKRQLRELYRHSKNGLARSIVPEGKGVAMSFMFCDSRLWTSSDLALKYDRLLKKLIALQTSCEPLHADELRPPEFTPTNELPEENP